MLGDQDLALLIGVVVCVCMLSSPIYSGRRLVDVPAGVRQEEGPTGFLHLPSE